MPQSRTTLEQRDKARKNFTAAVQPLKKYTESCISPKLQEAANKESAIIKELMASYNKADNRNGFAEAHSNACKEFEQLAIDYKKIAPLYYQLFLNRQNSIHESMSILRPEIRQQASNHLKRLDSVSRQLLVNPPTYEKQ